VYAGQVPTIGSQAVSVGTDQTAMGSSKVSSNLPVVDKISSASSSALTTTSATVSSAFSPPEATNAVNLATAPQTLSEANVHGTGHGLVLVLLLGWVAALCSSIAALGRMVQ